MLMDPLAGLNREQREAVEHFEGPLLVLAGAGSGKTRVLTTRIAHLIHESGVDASSILAVTFTNKAAGEMRERVRHLLDREPAGMWIGTFHSIGARMLRRHAQLLGWTSGFSIYDADASLAAIRRVMARENVSEKKWAPKAVRAALSDAKNRLVSPEEYESLAADPFSRTVSRIYVAYQVALREQNAFDFDDLLVKPVELLRQLDRLLTQYRARFQFILVDEYQDTNRAQDALIELLAHPEANLMVVGDDDQAIYGWRGADVTNILEFDRRYAGTRLIRLEQNYRSTQRILNAANAIIARNTRRKGKTLRTEGDVGERLTLVEAADERDEADWVGSEIQKRLEEEASLSPREVVLLYRTNAQSRELERALVERSLPYRIVGGTRFFERREIMDVLAYLRLVSNPRDTQAFERIVNYPRRGVGDVALERLREWAAGRGSSLLEAAAVAREIPSMTPAAGASLERFAASIAGFRERATVLGAGELVELVVADTGLMVALAEEGPEGEDREANVRELIAGAYQFDDRLPALRELEDLPAEASALDLFLQDVALITDVDRHDPSAHALTLMTVHTAKGLEFPLVFITGMEDGLFPLARAYDQPSELEEERRLFYVGVTRAERKVYLTHARTRRRLGERMDCVPSSFLAPLDDELLERRRTPELERQARAYERWNQPRPRLAARGRQQEVDVFGNEPGGLIVDYSDSQDAPRFIKGERVRHPEFGSGTIRELAGFGRDLKAVIDFDRIGRKKVVVRYANLQKEY
jgi:DNA helicase II / ATP-dependent DNA helicase PcrA